ncbi:hypothetical protein D1872_324340 [compost metagenome]
MRIDLRLQRLDFRFPFLVLRRLHLGDQLPDPVQHLIELPSGFPDFVLEGTYEARS